MAQFIVIGRTLCQMFGGADWYDLQMGLATLSEEERVDISLEAPDLSEENLEGVDEPYWLALKKVWERRAAEWGLPWQRGCGDELRYTVRSLGPMARALWPAEVAATAAFASNLRSSASLSECGSRLATLRWARTATLRTMVRRGTVRSRWAGRASSQSGCSTSWVPICRSMTTSKNLSLNRTDTIE